MEHKLAIEPIALEPYFNEVLECLYNFGAVECVDRIYGTRDGVYSVIVKTRFSRFISQVELQATNDHLYIFFHFSGDISNPLVRALISKTIAKHDLGTNAYRIDFPATYFEKNENMAYDIASKVYNALSFYTKQSSDFEESIKKHKADLEKTIAKM